MRFAFNFFPVSLLVLVSSVNLAAQNKDRVEAAQKFITATTGKVCKDLKPGRIVVFSKPIYPAEAKAARAGGTVQVMVKIDESGNVAEIERIEGAQLLQTAAADATRKAKYKPPVCDGAATGISAVFTYNFIPFVSAESYFTPTKIGEFIDLKSDSPFYEAVLNLTENYRFAFGYADKKFYADAPLTRGDFAQFLRLTLDLLSERATTAKKLPREIGLFYPYNSRKITSVNNIKDLKRDAPFYDSVKTLVLKYDIVLIDDKNEFQGSRHLTNNQVIDLWSKVFGAEATPVNFGKISDGDRIISRGEFALFLQESLQVLTYKVLP